jgi:hypothetical protein
MNLADKVATMNTFDTPWYHGYVDDFLEKSYYTDMCTKIDNVTSGIKEGEGHAVNNQTIIDITQIQGDDRPFWQEFIQQFSTSEFLQAMQDVSKISGKFDEIRYDIHRCEAGFKLNQHNDVKGWLTDMASLQIYCARDMSMANEGTTLLGEQEKLIEYIPNRAWLFSCGENTFHKVEPISAYRTSILMKFGVRK